MDEELPLDEPCKGRPTHTNPFRPPDEEIEDGPTNVPLEGVSQPFIRFTFDEGTVEIR